ncbi:MAG: flagellar hook capping FlgD N-terminal domain-containing protein [Thermanaerothrix sp.]|uniref:flagellar hook capping FlgD N-terminal domain-containing protein n=1 Tax=Thermanaerothrix sp. TaxID=2972675 RepID=UPI003C7A450C
MSTISPVMSLSQINPSNAPINSLSGLSADDFVTLLMAQLRNQNPLEPLQDKDLMAQFAQLNSLEALKQIKEEMEALLQVNLSNFASSLIGKQVTTTTTEGQVIRGTVLGYEIRGGVYYVQVGEAWLPLREITQVSEGGSDGSLHQANL